MTHSKCRSARVSICIPTFNSSQTICSTIESVLAQTHQDFEILVSDGGSEDLTVAKLSEYDDSRIVVSVSPERLPPWANWTRAVGLSTGEFVMLLCHDDILFSNAIERLLELHANYPEAVATAGSRLLINDNGVDLGIRRKPRAPIEVWSRHGLIREVHRTGTNPIGEGLCVLWKSAATPGSFSPTWNYYIDLDYWMKLLQIGPIVQSETIIGAFRVSATSWTSNIGLKVGGEIWKFFKFLYQTEAVDRRAHYRGVLLAMLQGFLRPFFQTLVNSRPFGYLQARRQLLS